MKARVASVMLASLCLAVALAPPPPARACMAIGRSGPIRIRGEEALIVWDPTRRTEHFIRAAQFDPQNEDFGFLVPTPSRPILAEADAEVFAKLFEIYRRPEPRGGRNVRGRQLDGLMPASASVRVLERRTVAGLDAAVLAANDATALTTWLRQQNYPSSPALTAWLAPYVTQRWIVTAFKIDPGADRSSGFATRALRMTFQTDRPYFPYSEAPPAAGATAAEGRPFRVSIVAPTRMRGMLGAQPWATAATAYAQHPPTARLRTALRGSVPDGALAPGMWLTVLDEPRSVRGAQDLFFEPDPVRRTVPSSITSRIIP